jgi:transcriptional antiterminator
MVSAPAFRQIFQNAVESHDAKLLKHAFERLDTISKTSGHEEPAVEALLIECADTALKVSTRKAWLAKALKHHISQCYMAPKQDMASVHNGIQIISMKT